jgi:hypothetical protein
MLHYKEHAPRNIYFVLKIKHENYTLNDYIKLSSSSNILQLAINTTKHHPLILAIYMYPWPSKVLSFFSEVPFFTSFVDSSLF